MTGSETWRRRVTEDGVVAIVRGVDPDRVVDTVAAIRRGGVRVVEVTTDSEGVRGMLRTLSGAFGDEVTLGAGTVLDAETARVVLDAGATFLVTPTFSAEVIEVANRRGAPIVVGVDSPTEAHSASAAGAALVKVFPATTFGPEFVAALDRSVPSIRTVPTGGVDPDIVGEFVRAGATAVGVGSAIVDGDAVARGDFETVEGNARRLLTAVAAAREELD